MLLKTSKSRTAAIKILNRSPFVTTTILNSQKMRLKAVCNGYVKGLRSVKTFKQIIII